MLLEILKNEFKQRADRNSQYSLRAFAKSLKMHSSTLSAILNKKRRITPAQAQKILNELNLDHSEKKRILLEMLQEKSASTEASFEKLDEAAFQVVSGWEHFALLACLDLDSSEKSTEQLAQKMKLPFSLTVEALERLHKLGLVLRREDHWQTTGKSFTTTNEVPSSALRKTHREYIHKALDSLQKHSVDERDITGISMAISTKKLASAKKMIAAFRRELAEHLESDPKDEVYRLNIQLFPLSK